MSAFFVSKMDIDLIVSAISEWRCCESNVRQHGSFDALGKMLWTENLNSLRARYPDCSAEHAGYAAEIAAYTAKLYLEVKTIPLCSIVDCYAYQSCEHDGWEGSEALDICRQVKDEAIRRLPGYKEAPWGVSDSPERLALVCNPNVISLLSLAKKGRKRA